MRRCGTFKHHRWKKREKNLFSSGKNTKLTAVVAGRCGRGVSVERAPQRGDSEWTTVDSVHYAPTNAHTHTHLLLAVRMKVVAVGNC